MSKKRVNINTKQYVRKILLGISDTHGLFQQGLMNPDTPFINLETGDTYKIPLNPTQEILWNTVYLPGIKSISELAGESEIIGFVGGDVTHGKKYPEGLITDKLYDQLIVGAWNFHPICDLPQVKSVVFATGTGAHVFGSGSSEFLVTVQLQNKYPTKKFIVAHQKNYNIDGFKVNLFHHGPNPGTRKHTMGNVARFYLRDRMLDSTEEGIPPANLYLCGHYHRFIEVTQWVRSGGQDYNSRLIILPPMCTFGDWGLQVLKSMSKVEVGMIAIEIVNGKHIETHKFTHMINLQGEDEVL